MAHSETLRADAARNREAILVAAREVFSEQGYLAPLSDIAHRAGVGRATMHRRFPHRVDLILELLQQNMARLEEMAEALHDEDDALFTLLAEMTRQISDGSRFVDFLYRHEVPPAHLRRIAEQLVVLTEPALRRGQRAGLLREDLTPYDVVILADMLMGPLGHRGPLESAISERAERTLSLVIAAIRPG